MPKDTKSPGNPQRYSTDVYIDQTPHPELIERERKRIEETKKALAAQWGNRPTTTYSFAAGDTIPAHKRLDPRFPGHPHVAKRSIPTSNQSSGPESKTPRHMQ